MSGTISTKGHLPGRPVAASTYGNPPSQRAQAKAVNAAVAWVRANHPDVWKRFYDEAYMAELTR